MGISDKTDFDMTDVGSNADERFSGRTLTILVVDDDVLILTNNVVLLEDLGYTVVEAGSGAEALRLLRGRGDIDLMITDQVMPAMTGSELIATVRAECHDLPIILASGYGEIPAGGDANVYHLAKPFGQADLKRAVSAATGQG